MTNVIDFSERLGPDADCVWTDDQGVKWFKYTANYKHEDKRFSLHLWARSFEDANASMESLKKTGVIDGQVYAEYSEGDIV